MDLLDNKWPLPRESHVNVVINAMMLRRRDERNHLGNNTVSRTYSGIRSAGRRNGTGRMVRFATDLPANEHGRREFSAHSRQDTVVPLANLQKPRKGSFSWKPVLRRNSAPARVPAASKKKHPRTPANDDHVTILLAANEIERILRDDVHSRDNDQMRLDEDDEDDDASYDEDSTDLGQSKKHHQENDSVGQDLVVSVPRTRKGRNSFTLASSVHQRLLGSSTFWSRPQRTSASTTSTPLPEQARHDEETRQQGVDHDKDDDNYELNYKDDNGLTEHDVNAYNLFDSAGADEARWRLYQRRKSRRRDESDLTSHHIANNNSPHVSLLSWTVPLQGLPSSLYYHDSAVIYSGKPYDLRLLTSFLVVVSAVFAALVVLQIVSRLWLLSTTLGGWILMTAAVTGPLIQLWQFTGRLMKMFLRRVEPYFVWFRRRFGRIRRPALSPATTTTTTASSSSGSSSSNSNIHQFCSICLETYCDNDDDCSSLFQRQYLVVCKHSFHHHCIQQWLEHNDSCPICRVPTSFESYKNIHSPSLPSPPQYQHYSHIAHHSRGSRRCRRDCQRGLRLGDGTMATLHH